MTARKQMVLAILALGLGGVWLGQALLAEPPAPTNKKAVTAQRDPLGVAAVIDGEVERILAENKVPYSPLADDAEFLHRLSLDVRGRIPTPEVTAAFLADADPDKRRKLIDRFLADPEYGEHFGIIWYHRMIKPSTENQFVISRRLQDWLASRFNQNQGWDRIVHDVLTAQGERDSNPATVFWLAHVENKKILAPERVTASASHLFLGVKLECCECHNHPFDTLKQTDFWGVTAFFTGTHLEHAAKKEVKAGGIPAVVEGGTGGKGRKAAADREHAPPGSVVIPDSKGQVVKARFLLGATPVLNGRRSMRAVFADWLTARDNPWFARAAVNKMWANFFGRGIINPIDDLRADSRTNHPELLKVLADEFTASGFDLKHLVRCICNSKTYQRTSTPLPENKADEELFSHLKLKPMTADMLFDSLTVALAHEPASKEGSVKGAKVTKVESTIRDKFRRFFNAEADDDAGVVEDYTHGIPQVLRLMNSGDMNNTRAVVARLLKADASPETTIEALFLHVLSRRPSAAEARRMKDYVAEAKDPARGYADMMWVLLNSSEFLFNH